MDNMNQRQLFEEITHHLLIDDAPSEYLNRVSEEDRFRQYPFEMLVKLKSTGQSIKYHPEGNVWNHTMLVVDEAAKVRERCRDTRAFLWAALLHDIGKPGTTRVKKDRITSYDHDKEGESLSREFLRAVLDGEEDFIRKVSSLVRYHMHILYLLKNLPYKDMEGLQRSVDINEIALLCRCDRLGRAGVDRQIVEAEYGAFLSELQEIQYTGR